MGIRREDFREVTPTQEEKDAWIRFQVKRYGSPNSDPVELEQRVRSWGYPYRAECKRCGERIWYSGIGIGAHLRGRRHREARA